jgi:hypothetical protein
LDWAETKEIKTLAAAAAAAAASEVKDLIMRCKIDIKLQT